MENWKVKIVDKGYTDTRDVFLFRRDASGRTAILHGDRIDTYEDGAVRDEPSMCLTSEMLQAFAEALNDQGFKPLKGFLEGKLDATEKHLEDMRTLVFKEK